MDWTQLITFLVSIFGLFLWVRSEARNDQQELRQSIAASQTEMREIIRTIQEEIRDFHGRLCAIEERRKK